MQKIKMEIEIGVNQASKVSAEILSDYALRAIAGVAAANKAVITSYRYCKKEYESNQTNKVE